MTTIKVLLVDDHQMVREGLGNLLRQQSNLDVVGEAADGWMAIEMVREQTPDIVVMDVGMPGLNGIEAARQIVAEVPKTKVIALSVHGDKRFVNEMLKAGASGYLLKANAFVELVRAIGIVMAGQVYLSPEIASLVVESYLNREHEEGHSSTVFMLLTPRERQILQLLAEGHTTRDIANMLYISQKTVDVHRQNISKKLQLHTLADLIKYAIKEGLVSLDN